jgi:pilus assembly protein Flp/PilA
LYRFKEKSMQVVQYFKDFLQEEDGVTAIEYGLIAALIAVVIIAALQAVGGNLTAVFQFIADALAAALA